MVKHRGGVCARGWLTAGRAKRARRGIGLAGDFRGWSAIACGGGVREKVCSHLRWGEPFIKPSKYGSPPGRSFYSCKRNQNTLGAPPQDPCRWLCWIRIDLRREPKINPYCAQNRSQGSRSAFALSPHPLSRWRERGSDGRAIRNRQQRSRGVRACKNRKPPTLKYLFPRPIVPLLRGGDRGGGSPFCAPAQRR